MTRCPSEYELQALADGEAPLHQAHVDGCEACAARVASRRRVTTLGVEAADAEELPAARREMLRRQILDAPVTGATTLRPAGAPASRWFVPLGLAAAAALLVAVVVPTIDRGTTISAAEILDRSRATLSAQSTGVEVLTYDLELDGILGDMLPPEHAGRFTVEETIDHDREGRYRIVKLTGDGQMVGGAADDPTRGLRARYVRAEGRGFLFRFTTPEPAAFSVPRLKRMALQTFITLMQAHAGKTLREVERGGDACYEIDITESAAPAGSLVALQRGRAVVTVSDARLVELSAAGMITDQPFTIDFALRSREMRAAHQDEFDIPASPGDVIMEGDATGTGLWDVLTRTLGAVPASIQGPSGHGAAPPRADRAP